MAKKAASLALECFNCAAALELPLKKCSTCKAAFYCTQACQAQHWKKGGHKTVCKAPVLVSPSIPTQARSGYKCVICLGEATKFGMIKHVSCSMYVDSVECYFQLLKLNKCALCNMAAPKYNNYFFTTHEAKIKYDVQTAVAIRTHREFGENSVKTNLEMYKLQEIMMECGSTVFGSACSDPVARANDYIEIAGAYAENGLNDDAMRCLRRSIAFDPKNMVANVNLGFNYFLADDCGPACASLNTIVELNPDFITTKIIYAYALAKIDRIPEANTVFFDVCGHLENEVEVLHYLNDRILTVDYVIDNVLEPVNSMCLADGVQPIPCEKMVALLRTMLLRPDYVPSPTEGARKLFEMPFGYYLAFAACRIGVADRECSHARSFRALIKAEDEYYKGKVIYCKKILTILDREKRVEAL